MKNLFVLTVLVVATSALPSNLLRPMRNIYPTGRIINGTDTRITDVPHQVSIEIFGHHSCGGSIISNEWILTAGHCSLYPLSFYQIRIGTDNPESGGNVHRIAAIYTHENYSVTREDVPRHDIALFRLEKPIEINERQKTVKLFDKDEETVPGSYAVITGYGVTETGNIAVILKTVTVPVIDKQECFDAYVPEFGGIQEHQICAAYPDGGRDACEGDSGGPMTVNGRLAGIVSWGNGCGLKGNPGVYTEVAKYRDWIAKKTGLDL